MLHSQESSSKTPVKPTREMIKKEKGERKKGEKTKNKRNGKEDIMN